MTALQVLLLVLLSIAVLALLGLWPLLLGLFYMLGYVLYGLLWAIVFVVGLVSRLARKLTHPASRRTKPSALPSDE